MSDDTNANLSDGGTGDQGNGDGGEFTMPAFVSQLEGDLQKDERLTSYKDKTLTDFVKDSFSKEEEIQKLREASEGMIKLPGENATVEEIAEFNKAIGLPDTPDGYDIPRPENMPKNMVYDEVLEQKFREVAHNTGMTPTQVKAVAELVNTHGIESYEAITKAIEERRETAINALKNIWPGDQYKANTEKTFQAITAFAKHAQIPEGFGGEEGFKNWLLNTGMSDDPVHNWMWSKMFEFIGDDAVFLKGGGGSPTTARIEEQFFGGSMGHIKK